MINILPWVSPTKIRTSILPNTSPALYHWAIQSQDLKPKNSYTIRFAKHWTREYRENTTPSRIFMPCNLSSCQGIFAFFWQSYNAFPYIDWYNIIIQKKWAPKQQQKFTSILSIKWTDKNFCRIRWMNEIWYHEILSNTQEWIWKVL